MLQSKVNDVPLHLDPIILKFLENTKFVPIDDMKIYGIYIENAMKHQRTPEKSIFFFRNHFLYSKIL